MDELARQLSTLREEIVPAWDDARGERLLLGVGLLARRRQRQQLAAVSASVMACGMLLLAFSRTDVPSALNRAWPRGDSKAPSARPDVGVASAARLPEGVPVRAKFRFADGSLAELTAPGGQLEVLHDESMQVDLRLLRGTAHFDVVPNIRRHFVIEAGPVKVAVVGTVFDVERVQDRVRVTVTEGKVRVLREDGDTPVGAGESRWFEPATAQVLEPNAPPEARQIGDAASAAAAADEHGELRTEHGRKALRRDAGAKAVWRSLSQAGDYDAAYRSLAGGSAVDDDPLALMDAADAARLSGHPDAAVSYLRRVVQDHRASPVAPLAAFTLGRVFLERLGQPSEAADAFALSAVLAPYGSLAQDALAREVEALSKAGNAHLAYLRAREYVRTYPRGRRLRAVQLYGGLE